LEDGEKSGEENGGQDARTTGQRLYQKLSLFAAPILDGGAYYMKLRSEGFDDLVLEKIGEGGYSIAHYYEQNGDMMRDPEVTFIIDREKQSLHPTSYLQDNMGIYYETAEAAPEKVAGLEAFLSQWFTNIQQQGFEVAEVRGNEQEEDRMEQQGEDSMER
ncbi:MAG: hypothetical protein K2N94_15320, partial [Lachnospiraceae bacterium]|nr:hypothetical protein [Lachnospiraceae bacterium]